jgi:radical SAM-linked protein
MQTEQRHRLFFEFSIEGDLRFISHHDTMRLFRRACARADLPLHFSQGFNPQPRIMLPLPRPVGVASTAEALIIEFDKPIEPPDALARLRAQMPGGIELTGARPLAAGERPAPDRVDYRLELDQHDVPDLDRRIQGIMDADHLRIDRVNPKDGSVRAIDARPYLIAMKPRDGAVEFTVRVTADGSVKPAEVAGLFGFDPRYVNHRIRRLEVQWK